MQSEGLVPNQESGIIFNKQTYVSNLQNKVKPS